MRQCDYVLVIVNLDRDGWHSATNDAVGAVADLAELQPDLLARGAADPLSGQHGAVGCILG